MAFTGPTALVCFLSSALGRRNKTPLRGYFTTLYSITSIHFTLYIMHGCYCCGIIALLSHSANDESTGVLICMLLSDVAEITLQGHLLNNNILRVWYAVVVLTLAHRHNAVRSHTGQAPKTHDTININLVGEQRNYVSFPHINIIRAGSNEKSWTSTKHYSQPFPHWWARRKATTLQQ